MYTLGIDIGSTTSKCVILKDGTEITATSIVVAGTGTKGPEKALKEVFEKAGITREGIGAAIATGYGRKLFTEADKEISELSCHARGVHYIFPQVRTIIDIGGQDAKVLALNDQGRMSNFLMNDKCAAGTGRFLDVMAGILQLDIGDLEKLDVYKRQGQGRGRGCDFRTEQPCRCLLPRPEPFPKSGGISGKRGD